MQTRPPLATTYSQNHTTVFVRAQGAAVAEADAFVFCQLKKRACRRDGFGHALHTAWFNTRNAMGRAFCLKEPAGRMEFPPSRQGRAPLSPLREQLTPPHWPASMG